MNRLAVRILFVSTLLFISGISSELIAQQADEVELTSTSGSAEVFLLDSVGYVPAQEGINLGSGDFIKTGSDSSAEISFNKDNTNLVRLGANTTIKIVLLDDEKLEMTEGEVFSSINKLPSGSAFEIRTPTAISGARGTDWVTKVNQDGTDVEAIDSEPYVRHFEADGTVSSQITPISPGQMTTVQKFQKPMTFRPIPEARRQQWQALRQDVCRRGSEAVQKRQERPPFNRQEFIQKNRVQRVLDSQNSPHGRKFLGNGLKENFDEKGGVKNSSRDGVNGGSVSDRGFGPLQRPEERFPEGRNMGQHPERDNGKILPNQDHSGGPMRRGQEKGPGVGPGKNPSMGPGRGLGKGPSGGPSGGINKRPGAGPPGGAAGRGPGGGPAGGQRGGNSHR